MTKLSPGELIWKLEGVLIRQECLLIFAHNKKGQN